MLWHSTDPKPLNDERPRLVGEALADSSPDLVRQLLQTTVSSLLSADADAFGWDLGEMHSKLSGSGQIAGMRTHAFLNLKLDARVRAAGR